MKRTHWSWIVGLSLLALTYQGCADSEDGFDNGSSNGAQSNGVQSNGVGTSNGVASPLAGALKLVLDKAVDDGLPGAVVYVKTPTEQFTVVAGLSKVENQQAFAANHMFRIASNSKTFLGVIAASLHDDGTLDLDAPVRDVLSDTLLNNIVSVDQVSLRQLLNHTAGIPDYLGTDGFWDAVDGRTFRTWTPEEALTYAYDEPALFAPGTSWEYSNSNYLLAGLVIDAHVGAKHATVMRSRIFEALGMTQAFYEVEEPPKGTLVHGYANFKGDEALDNTFDYAQGYGLADGGLVMTAEELGMFIEALGSKDTRLLTPGAQTEMMRDAAALEDGERYGLGLSHIDFGDRGKAWGHGGNVLGYTSEMFYFEDPQTTIVLFTNGSDGDLDDLFADLKDNVLAEILD